MATCTWATATVAAGALCPCHITHASFGQAMAHHGLKRHSGVGFTVRPQLLERDVAAEEARVAAALEAQRQRRAQQAQAAAEFNRLQLQRKVGCRWLTWLSSVGIWVFLQEVHLSKSLTLRACCAWPSCHWLLGLKVASCFGCAFSAT